MPSLDKSERNKILSLSRSCRETATIDQRRGIWQPRNLRNWPWPKILHELFGRLGEFMKTSRHCCLNPQILRLQMPEFPAFKWSRSIHRNPLCQVRGFHGAVGAQSTQALHCTAGRALSSATDAGVHGNAWQHAHLLGDGFRTCFCRKSTDNYGSFSNTPCLIARG